MTRDGDTGTGPDDKTVAERLRGALKESGLSVRAFAKRTGRDKSQISRWLNGTHSPDRENARLLAEFFGKPKDYFFKESRQRRAERDQEIVALRREVAELRQAVKRLEEERGPDEGRSSTAR